MQRSEVQAATELRTREHNLNSVSTVTLLVVLGGVTMTFGAMIVVFLVRAHTEAFWSHIQIPSILWATTVVLLASSVLFELSRRKLAVNDQVGFHKQIMVTTGLGLLFLFGQVAAWAQVLRSGVTLENNPHAWFILLFCALHGMHILAGIAGQGYLVYRTREQVSGPRYQMNTRVAARGIAVFWHYLDFMWLVLFALLLLWKR